MTFIRKLKTKTGTYLVKVENIWRNGKVKQKHLGVVGKIVHGKEILYGQIQTSKITDVSIAGRIMVLKDVMDQLELKGLLDFYTDDRGKWIAALILAHCTNPASVNKMKKWCKKYGASDLLDIHPDECRRDRFYRALDKLDEKSVMQIEKALYKRFKKFKREKDSLFYDVTTTYFYGTKCNIAKSGYNPQRLGEPQINIGLVVTKSCGFPIFHQVYDGNIQDARSIHQVLRTLKDFGIEKTTLIWDRGITSEPALRKAKSNFNLIIGLPLKGGLKDKAIKMREGIASINNRIRLSTQILYARSFPFKVYGHNGKLVVCSNEKERSLLKEIRYDEIERSTERIKKGLKVKEKIKKYVIDGKINHKEIEKSELTDGLYALFSTDTSLTAKEIVRAYFDKDIIEKAFKCLKGTVKLRPIRHWLTNRVKAHVFICYLSYALFSALNWKLKSSGLEISLEESLNLLEDLYRVKIHDPQTKNSFVKHSVMSKKQESIFKAVNKDLIEDLV